MGGGQQSYYPPGMAGDREMLDASTFQSYVGQWSPYYQSILFYLKNISIWSHNYEN